MYYENIDQHEKIRRLFVDGGWHCVNDVRRIYVFSFHKRRTELEDRKSLREPVGPRARYYFEERKCEHGVRNQKDFKMLENPNYIPFLGTAMSEEEKIKQLSQAGVF